MDDYLGPMSKTWSSADVRELAVLAKRKGIKKGELAEMIGIHATTLSGWMNPSRSDEIPVLSQNALSFIEIRILRMKDKD